MSGTPYKALNGNIVFPLGSYTIVETKTPRDSTGKETGLLLNETKYTVITSINKTGDGVNVKVTDDKGKVIDYKEDIKTTNSPGPIVKQIEKEYWVKLAVYKVDKEANENRPQGNATLKGCVFNVYANEDMLIDGTNYKKGDKVAVYKDRSNPGAGKEEVTITTDETGYGETNYKLPYGNYYLKETKAPKGYNVNVSYEPVVQTFVDHTYKKFNSHWSKKDGYNTFDTLFEDIETGDWKAVKVDEDVLRIDPQGDAALNAEFKIVNISHGKGDGQNPDGSAINTSGKRIPATPLPIGSATWDQVNAAAATSTMETLTVDPAKKNILVNPKHLQYGDYAIIETRKPEGYHLNKKVYFFSVTKQGEFKDYGNFLNKVERASIKFVKHDAETNEQKAQGAGSLAEIRYAVVNRSKSYAFHKGIEYKVGEVVDIVVTDESGTVTCDNLPYGTYQVYELRKDATLRRHDMYDTAGDKLGKSIYANDSYLFTSTMSEEFTIDKPEMYTVPLQETVVLHKVGSTYIRNYKNFPVRGDITLNKYDIDGKPMEYIPFAVSLLDSKGKKLETHVIVTNEKGELNTQLRKNKSVDKINKLDKYLKGGKYTGPLNAEAAQTNIWFGDQHFVMNNRGSCLYGNYIIEELQTAKNKGQDLTTHNVYVDKEQIVHKPQNVVVDLNLRMKSKALDVASDSNTISLGKSVKVQDTIELTHTKIYNTYEIVTEVVNVHKDGTTTSVAKSEPKMIKPKKMDNTMTSYPLVVNKFKIDSSKLKPGSYIAMVDYLYQVDKDGNRILVKTHNKFHDVESQMLLVPDMKSVAHNFTTGTRHGSLKPNSVVADKVIYKNLGNKVLYRMVEELFYEDGTVVKDKDGKPAKAEQLLYIDYRQTEAKVGKDRVIGGQDGEFFMPKFELDSASNAGKTIMIKQTLKEDITGKTILIHNKRLTEDKQSLRWLDISTVASSSSGKEGIIPNSTKAEIVDHISYKNSAEPTDVKIKTILVEKSSGKKVSENITNTKIGNGDGKVDVKHIFDSTPYANKELVVFEYIYIEHNGKDVLISKHDDINDKKQTVRVPDIKTTLHSVMNNKKFKIVKKIGHVKLIDTVKYTNVKPGEEYTFTATLMNKRTGEKVLDKDGKVVTGKKTIKPKEANGEVDVLIEFDKEVPLGTEWESSDGIVCFESMKGDDDIEYATHNEIEDKSQTVLEPKFRTKAVGFESEDHIVLADREQKIIDYVRLKDFVKGDTLTLVIEAHDPVTGNPILDKNGKVYTNTKTFKYEGQKEEPISLTMDLTEFANKDVVFYEYMYVGDKPTEDGKIDKEDNKDNKEQTVHIPKLGTKALDKDTNENIVKNNGTIIDTIKYENILPEKEYTIKTKLVDKKTGKFVLDKNKKEAEFTMKWTSPAAKDGETTVSGEVEVPISLKDLDVEGKTLVVFERLYIGKDKLVGKHEDKDDEEQTTYVPKVRTKALDKADKDNTIDGTKDEQTIVDTVKCWNLIVGKEYTINGKLMDKSTGKVALDKDGKEVTASKTFVAEKTYEEHELEFTVDGTKYAGEKLVAFETLQYKGVDLCVHADLEDKEQTVNVSLLLDIRIAKADAAKINYFIKGAEITIFNQDGTIAKDINGKKCVGLTDENGEVKFTVLYDENNKMYAKETKAPKGYYLNKKKFFIKKTGKATLGVDLIKIRILDKAIIIPPRKPRTGDISKIGMFAGMFIISGILAIGVYCKVRKA